MSVNRGGAGCRGFFEFENGYDEAAWDGEFEIVECRRALSPSGLPHIDYALNPYGGCEHGCVYCYAPEVTRTPWEEWRKVRVRENIPERLSRELPGISGTVGVGTSTDPYQGAERRFRLTRRCLGILRNSGFDVHIHTKSDIILDDIDLIADMKASVEVTITGVDRRTSLITEPGAPLPDARLDALRSLVFHGVRASALVEPVMSTISGREDDMADAIASTGVRRVLLGGLNGRPELNVRLSRMRICDSPETTRRLACELRDRGLTVVDPFVKYSR